jgi:hypothetical protein
MVLRHAGLPAALLDEEKVLVTTEELFAIYRAISELSDDPATGLNLGAEERMERYDPVAIAALCTRSFRDAVHRLARYKQLTCPEELQIEGGRGRMHCAVRMAPCSRAGAGSSCRRVLRVGCCHRPARHGHSTSS